MADDFDEPSYIDYEAFLDPAFSATNYANKLVLATNNPSDTPIDISTPLSRVLFDVQEVDTHIDTLTTKSALPLLERTQYRGDASSRILQQVETQMASLTESYKTLEKEIIVRHEAAEQVRLTAERLCQTLKIGRAVGRSVMLGRQLEVQMAEFRQPGSGNAKREDHRAMVRASNTLLSLRQLFDASAPGAEGEGLSRIAVVTTLRNDFISPSERAVLSRSQQIIREFSMSSLVPTSNAGAANGATSDYAQSEETKARTISAAMTLYLLSPLPGADTTDQSYPSLLVSALQDYLQTAQKASLASLSRALATLPSLDRTLLEISARCQNIVGLEALLESIKPIPHPLLPTTTAADPTAANGTTTTTTKLPPNFLQPLLQALDTASLPSYFWRSLGSALSPKVQEIMHRGGVSARTLRSNREKVREAVRECVNRGSQLQASAVVQGKDIVARGWEREAAVMVGSIMGALGR